MPYFTKANAREMAAKGNKVRWSQPEIVTLAESLPATAESYQAKCLTRTRAQLDLVAEQITAELSKPKLDSRRLRDLTDAQSRLSEQERILAGRPLPGSRKPGPERAAGRSVGVWDAMSTPATGPEPGAACGLVATAGSVPATPADPAKPQATE